MSSSKAEPRAATHWRAFAVLTLSIVASLLAVQCTNQPATATNARPAPQLCDSGPTHASDQFALVHGFITYTYGSEIWAVDPKHPANRTSLGVDGGPFRPEPLAWSRDGDRLLLLMEWREAGAAGITWDLCAMNADGSQTRLTGDGLTREGSFSPDGTKVVFSRVADDGLYVVDAKGGTPHLITKATANVGSVAWSPDGSRIAYIVYWDPPMTFGIWTVNPDGTDPRQLVVDPRDCGGGACSAGGGLAWSPDGSMLAFHSRPGSGGSVPSGIYVVHADGSGLHRITGDGVQPSWSPDGKRIAFTRYDGFANGFDLFTVASDGSDEIVVDGVAIVPPYVAWNPVIGR